MIKKRFAFILTLTLAISFAFSGEPFYKASGVSRKYSYITSVDFSTQNGYNKWLAGASLSGEKNSMDKTVGYELLAAENGYTRFTTAAAGSFVAMELNASLAEYGYAAVKYRASGICGHDKIYVKNASSNKDYSNTEGAWCENSFLKAGDNWSVCILDLKTLFPALGDRILGIRFPAVTAAGGVLDLKEVRLFEKEEEAKRYANGAEFQDEITAVDFSSIENYNAWLIRASGNEWEKNILDISVESSYNSEGYASFKTKNANSSVIFDVSVPTASYKYAAIAYRSSGILNGGFILTRAASGNTSFSGALGTAAPPRMTGDRKWHIRTIDIDSELPAAGELITGVSIPAAFEVKGVLDVKEILFFKTAAELSEYTSAFENGEKTAVPVGTPEASPVSGFTAAPAPRTPFLQNTPPAEATIAAPISTADISPEAAKSTPVSQDETGKLEEPSEKSESNAATVVAIAVCGIIIVAAAAVYVLFRIKKKD